MTFRINDRMPEEWNPATKEIYPFRWETQKGRISVYRQFQANESVFIVFRKKTREYERGMRSAGHVGVGSISANWKVQFDKKYGGPEAMVVYDKLENWSVNSDPAVKYYSGTAVYSNSFHIEKREGKRSVRLEFDSIYNIATIKINGINCGTLWTAPFSLDISKAVREGENKIEIEVTNTWHNRLIGDNLLPPGKRVTWTTAPFRLKDKPLLPAGLMGKVILEIR